MAYTFEKKDFDLTGKVAWVTGGSYGIGFAIASGFAKCGAKICFNDLNEDKMKMGVEAYKKIGIEAYGFVCDVTKEDQVQKAVKQHPGPDQRDAGDDPPRLQPFFIEDCPYHINIFLSVL